MATLVKIRGDGKKMERIGRSYVATALPEAKTSLEPGKEKDRSEGTPPGRRRPGTDLSVDGFRVHCWDWRTAAQCRCYSERGKLSPATENTAEGLGRQAAASDALPILMTSGRIPLRKVSSAGVGPGDTQRSRLPANRTRTGHSRRSWPVTFHPTVSRPIPLPGPGCTVPYGTRPPSQCDAPMQGSASTIGHFLTHLANR